MQINRLSSLPPPADEGSHLTHRVNGARFVIRMHHGHQHGFLAQSLLDIGGVDTTCLRAHGRPRTIPRMARLFASVPPLVKTISVAEAPKNPATVRRAL